MWLVPAVLVAVLIRLARPVILIRIGRLTSQRIGHFIFDTEVYLCQRDIERRKGRKFDVFFNGSLICNMQLKKMWDRTINVHELAVHVYRANRRLPGGDAHTVAIKPWSSYNQDMRTLIGITNSHLLFTAEEEVLGCRELNALGISDETPFVCFHARDSSYLESTIPENDWLYHSYRDADINNFLPAIEELGRRGYISLRMGAIVSERLDWDEPSIVDYATTHRTDFMDLYLCARCRFFLGSHTGLFMAASAFRRPSAVVNVIPYEMITTWGADDLFIPKKLWLAEQDRYMTFAEIYSTGVPALHSTPRYEERGIEPVENTPEEIAALATEMDDRLNQVWQSWKEDQRLQERFWSIFHTEFSHGEVVSRIGADFLRQNQEMLA